MAVNSVSTGNNVNISQVSASYENVTFSAEITKTTNTAAAVGVNSNEAAVYEKSEEADQVSKFANHKIDTETIEKLKADAEERNAQLRGIVEKLLLKQGGTILNAGGLASMYRSLEVDEETRAQAQKDIADDGYWGVEQTSDRIVDFAKAMAGDNLELAKQMFEAIKTGFDEATDEWGEDLPDLSQRTMKATFDKMDEWIKSLGGDSDSEAPATTGNGAVAAAAQTTTTTVKVSASYTKASVAATSIDITQ